MYHNMHHNVVFNMVGQNMVQKMYHNMYHNVVFNMVGQNMVQKMYHKLVFLGLTLWLLYGTINSVDKTIFYFDERNE